MAEVRFVPAATLLRQRPGTLLAATPAGSVVHVLNRPAGTPLCHRDRTSVAPLPVWQPAPPLRVCEFCIRAMPAAERLQLEPTDRERTAVREHAARQRVQPLALGPPDEEGP